MEKDKLDFLHHFLLDTLLIELLLVPTTVIDVFIHCLYFFDVSQDVFKFLLPNLLSVHNQRIQDQEVLLFLNDALYLCDTALV